MPAYAYSCKYLHKHFGLVYLNTSMARQKRPRTYARNRPKRYVEKIYESDSTYFLKLVACVLLGMLWLGFAQPLSWYGISLGGIPLGMLIGLLLVRQFEKHQSNRKIWYAILLVATIISQFMPAGIVI